MVGSLHTFGNMNDDCWELPVPILAATADRQLLEEREQMKR